MDKVKLNIITTDGEIGEELTAEDAIARIKELNKSGKWLYLDHQIATIDALTPDMLLSSIDITITNDLQGG